MNNIEAEVAFILTTCSFDNDREKRLRTVLENLHEEIDFLREARKYFVREASKDLQAKLTKIELVMGGEL